MTDPADARDSLDIHPTAPYSPSATPALSTDPLPAISFLEAESRKAELFANEEWRTRYFANDVQATREYNQIVAGLTTPSAAPANEREAIVEHLRQYGDISEAVADEIRSGRASTPWEHQRTLEKRNYLFQDAGWVARYQAGDRQARMEVALIDLILSRPVRDDPFQP